jgi:hypothetical protein
MAVELTLAVNGAAFTALDKFVRNAIAGEEGALSPLDVPRQLPLLRTIVWTFSCAKDRLASSKAVRVATKHRE